MTLTVGTDPEVFFTLPKTRDRDGGQRSVLPAKLAFSEVEHTDWRISLPDGDLIVDGAALEYQPNPSDDPLEVVDNIGRLIMFSQSMSDRTGYPLAFLPELPIDLKWCIQDPELAVFGCDPDQSAWGEECRPGTIDASKHPWRYAGCHIHIGVAGDTAYFRQGQNMLYTVKALDRTVGLASMVIGNGTDARRRSIYGRPGVYRHQPHGMEYRTPSNAILRSPELLGFVFRLALDTADLVIGGNYGEFEAAVPDELVVGLLRSGNLDIAREQYARISNIFGLADIPSNITVNWKVAWGV